MKNAFLRVALATLIAAPVIALAEGESAPAPQERKLTIKIPAGASREEIREALKKQGIPDDVIEQILKKFDDAKAGAGSASGTAVSSAPVPVSSSKADAPSAPTSNGENKSAPAAPAPLKADHLNSQAMESKDPAFAADRKELENLRQQKALLEAEIALIDSKRRVELAPLADARGKIDAERSIRAARIAAQNAAGDAEKARIEKKIAAITAKISRELNEKNLRIATIEAESRLLRAQADADSVAPSSVSALRRADEEDERVAASAPVYLDDPLKDGSLYISDRRIPFNGVVCDRLADFVEKRIEFYNNKDPKKPIFIVIDNSPGGSVFSGIRILKAMEGSRAPVYVVVKQFCASMAAITTTLAQRSFMYPNTVILHHQMSTGFQGTMTDLRQRQKFTEELYEGTFKPVYTKIGYKSSADFEKDMYKHFASGDWAAFGDQAVRMKWVDHTVDRMIETGIRDFPAGRSEGRMPIFATGCVEKRDENGRVYYELPPLSGPGDAWVLHDPEHRFKAR